MRLIFAGTPVFAQRALQAIVAAGHRVVLVLTRPDRPAQRGQRLVGSPVKQWALAQGFEVWQPPTLRDAAASARLRSVGADAMVVAAYGMLLPAQVLAIPRLGCLNIHGSLLPRWRGAAPVQRAVQAGDTQTGITIMQMDAGLDTGPMRLVRTLSIGPDETAGSVHDRLAELGAQSIVAALAQLAEGTLPMVPQPQEGVTYATKITRADSVIDWTAPPRAIVDRLRALDPAPGGVAALARLPGTVLKIWQARVSSHTAGSVPGMQAVPVPHDPAQGGAGGLPAAAPGTVVAVGAQGITVACGDGRSGAAVDLLALQRPGGRRMAAREFLTGFPVVTGDRLQPPQEVREAGAGT